MRHIQMIHFTGKHVGEIFNMPIVKAVIKTTDNEPVVILRPDMMASGKRNILLPGQSLAQDETGKWHVINQIDTDHE